MKLLLSLLVVANVLLFGWLRGWMAPLGGDGREPQRLAAQVEPDQIRVVPAARLPGGAGSGDGGGPGSGARAAVGSQAASATPAEPPAAVDPAEIVASLKGASCVEIGPMGEFEAVRVQVALDLVASDLAITTRRAEDVSSYWVYLPPSSVDVQKRLADLRARGVSDVYLMPEGTWRGAISLGLFRQEELAVALQRSITDRGVKGVRVAPRGPSPGRMTLRVQPVPDTVPLELAKLRATFPEAVARPCAARG
jgi:hypothetical protein